MLFKMLKVERMKLKRSPIWIAFILMPVIPALLGTLNYMGNLEVLKSEWYIPKAIVVPHIIITQAQIIPKP